MSESKPPVTRFTKIKFDGSKVRLEWQVTRPRGGDPDEFAIYSSDKPLMSFVEVLHSLCADVCAICEFPVSEESKFTMRGVSLSYPEGVMGATLTALKTLMSSDTPLVINSPFLPETAKNGGYALPHGTVQRLRRLINEAERYRAGERAQGSLFGQPEPVPVKPPDGDGATGHGVH